VHQTEQHRITMQSAMTWLFFLYPISLAINKTANDIVSALIFLASCLCLVIHAGELRASLAGARRMWLLALSLPLLLVIIQHFALPTPLPLRDFDDMFRFFLCIPVYLALLIVRPAIRPFLWACAFFPVYTAGLMYWHMRILGLDRGISPNNFLAIIPMTSLSIILSMLALRLWVARDGAVRRRLAPAALLCIAFSVPLLSQTRSGLILAMALGIMLWFLLPNRNIKLLLYGAAAAAAVMAVVLTNSSLWARGDQTVAEIEHYVTQNQFANTSATIRLELWRFAGRMFVEHPLIGVGNHGFRAKLASYKVIGETPAALDLFTHPHNEFLKFAAEGGTIGIISIAMLYFAPLLAGLRRYRQQPSASNPALLLVVLCSGILFAGMVDVVLAWRPTILFYGLAVSLLLAHMDTSTETMS
jgi:O-antigen ligase